MDPAISPSDQARAGSGHLIPEWGAKRLEIHVKKPLHRRSWFRRLVRGLVCAVSLALALGIWKFDRWQTQRAADLVQQHRSVERFVKSEEFAAFARAADVQLLATINYLVARPEGAHDAFPAVAEWERAHHELPWALQISSLPISAAAEPERVAAAARDASRLLVRHSFVFDEPARTAGRRIFLRMLSPYAQSFVARLPEYDVNALWRERSLQETALAAFAARVRTATPRAEAERLFAIYAIVGPHLWQVIDQLQSPEAAVPPPR